MSALLASLLGVALIACAGETKTSHEAYRHRTDFYRNQVVTEVNGSFERVYEPEHHLRLARSAWLRGRPYHASRELNRAAAAISYLEDKASGERRQRLDEAERGLERLARELRRDPSLASERFETAIAAASEALRL
jgi:hypothetical protein